MGYVGWTVFRKRRPTAVELAARLSLPLWGRIWRERENTRRKEREREEHHATHWQRAHWASWCLVAFFSSCFCFRCGRRGGPNVREGAVRSMSEAREGCARRG